MTEPALNPYAAPTARVEDLPSDVGFAELKFFSPVGRIGRLRYLAYLTGGTFVHNFVFGLVTGLLGGGDLAGGVNLVGFLFLLVFIVFCAIKRCHDMNISGWFTLLAIVPFIGLAWVFWPGSNGANRFGPPPPPNTWGVRILGLLMPFLLLGILAAIAIPQYKDYTAKARAAQQAPR